MEHSAGDGIDLWLAVASERAAIVHLAAAGVRVAPGGPFWSGPAGGTVGRVGQARAVTVGRVVTAGTSTPAGVVG